MGFPICIDCYNQFEHPLIVERWSYAKCSVCDITNKQGMFVSYDVSKRCDNNWGCDHTKIEYRCGTHPVKICPVPDETILLPEK